MRYVVMIALILLRAGLAAAQAPVAGGESAPSEVIALRNCTALAESGKTRDAEPQGKVATSLYRQRLAKNPRDVEALVGLARAISQCVLPSAEFMEQGEMSSEAMGLLDRALEIQPDHWMARFVLASIAYRSPAFLGRGKRAAQELDALLRLQGDRTDNPMFARVFALRGMLLRREGAADSARALWRRGASLFPNDSALTALAQPPTPPDSATASATPTTTSLAAVQVVAPSAPPKSALPSTTEVSRSQVLLTAGGTADVLQAVQLQPGATRVGEGGDIYTRGGDPGETSLIVNGGRILSLARFEGLSGSMFGAIEPFVVKSVRYSSGGFSARHGNALSGVLEIETDGRPRERQSRAGLSLVQASGTLRAPLGTRTGGWVSSRLSHTGALLATHGRSGEFSGAPRSQEVIASIITAPTPFTELRATGIVERDDSRRFVSAAGWRGVFDSRGDTRALLLSSRWMSSSAPVVVRGTLAGSTHSNEWSFGALERRRAESDVSTRVDAEWEARAGMFVRAGVEQGAMSRLDRGIVPATASVVPGAPVRALGDDRSGANRIGGYGEMELTNGRVSLTAGVRADRLPGEQTVTIDPRLALSARSGAWTTRLSGGVFHQGRWRGDAAIPDAGTPSGLPAEAHHLVVGVEREGPTGILRAEAFVKRYGKYRAFGAGPRIDGTDVRGIDLLAQRTSGRITGWLGYSLLDAQSRLESGERVRSAFDVSHSATGAVVASLGADWSIGTTARYGSGAPRTPILGGAKDSNGRIVPVYGSLMSERVPAYARLDARAMRYIRTPGFLVTTFLEVLNVTDRGNVASYTYDATYTSREAVQTFFSRRTLVMGAELAFR